MYLHRTCCVPVTRKPSLQSVRFSAIFRLQVRPVRNVRHFEFVNRIIGFFSSLQVLRIENNFLRDSDV